MAHEGYRLDGKPHRTKTTSTSSTSGGATAASTSSSTTSLSQKAKSYEEKDVKPFYDYRVGLIRFIRDFDKLKNEVYIMYFFYYFILISIFKLELLKLGV